jgi:hypothetical protein
MGCMPHSLLLRFGLIFLKKFSLKEKIIHLVLAIFAFAYATERGRASEQFWEILAPLIWGLCLAVVWHSIATASRLIAEITQEQATPVGSRTSAILQGSGHPITIPVMPEVVRFYGVKILGITAVLCALAVLASYGTWLAEKPGRQDLSLANRPTSTLAPSAPSSSPKPQTAKPRHPKSSPPPVSPTPTPKPQIPTYLPIPIPIISPYQELQKEIAEVGGIAQQWRSDLSAAISTRGIRERKLGQKAREEAIATAEPMFRESVVREDERRIERWHAITGAVQKAHSDAIARMSQPGPTQWTPNQIRKDKAEFDGLLASMERPTEDSGNPDMQKFDPLLEYLKELLSKLGDYRESVTPPQ